MLYSQAPDAYMYTHTWIAHTYKQMQALASTCKQILKASFISIFINENVDNFPNFSKFQNTDKFEWTSFLQLGRVWPQADILFQLQIRTKLVLRALRNLAKHTHSRHATAIYLKSKWALVSTTDWKLGWQTQRNNMHSLITMWVYSGKLIYHLSR